MTGQYIYEMLGTMVWERASAGSAVIGVCARRKRTRARNIRKASGSDSVLIGSNSEIHFVVVGRAVGESRAENERSRVTMGGRGRIFGGR